MENQEDQEEIKPAPRRKWKRWVCLAVLLIIGPTQYLNHTGFCYAEMRYLNERELIDRFLFGDQADVMSYEDKVLFVAKKWNGANYPECCVIDGEPFDLSYFSRIMNKTFAAWYLYELKRYVPVIYNYKTTRHPYENIVSALDACGSHITADSTKIDIKKSEYENALERNRQYWTDKEKWTWDALKKRLPI